MRYNVKPGKMAEFAEWLKKNDQIQREHSAEGWTYLDTYFTVQGFGTYHCETRWEVDDYASLGGGFGDEEAQRLFAEWYGEFFDDRFPLEATLCKKVDAIRIPEGL